jgi:hypothetical protein
VSPRSRRAAIDGFDLLLAFRFDQLQHPELLFRDIRQGDRQPDVFGSQNSEAPSNESAIRCIHCLFEPVLRAAGPVADVDGFPIRAAGGAAIQLRLRGISAPSTRFSRDAFTQWREFQLWVETQMAEDGPLHEIQDWGSKLPGAVARIAGGIHCSLYAGLPIPSEVQCRVADVAIALGRLLVSHALAGFRIMQKPERIEHAEKLVAWVHRNGEPEFHLRDMFRSHQSRFGEMATMMPAVGLLQDHGYIRQREREKKTGRPPDVFEVNPELLNGGQV